MANVIYDKGLESWLEGQIAYLTGVIKVCLVTSGYVPNTSTHQFYSDLTPASNVVGTDQTLTSKTGVAGVANAANITFPSVSSGSTVNYLVCYNSTGVSSTSNLLFIIDTAQGLPFTTNGGNVNVNWDTGANKIFKL